MIDTTHPLQLIMAPIAPDSRRLNPVSLAVMPHAKNFETNANTQMRMVYPQVTPLSSNPRLVLSPLSMKYYAEVSQLLRCGVRMRRDERTRGKNKMETRSSNFSTRAIA